MPTLNRLEDYRYAALNELRKLMPKGELGDVDRWLDEAIRVGKGLPAKPENALPYERIIVLPNIGLLNGFHGDLAWIHAREGHMGYPYWPGGESGVTLDPGFDLGYQTDQSLTQYYAPILKSQAQLERLRGCIGVKGKAAQNFLARLRDIEISFSQANEVMPHIAKPYWEKIVLRFPTLDDDDTPESVQTALLSLSFNRGPGNRDLSVLSDPMAKKWWRQVAELIGNMQQQHALLGIRKRRQLEKQLIITELDRSSNG